MKAAARLFKNGGSQAIRLPKQFRFPGKTVVLERTKEGVLVSATKGHERSPVEAARIYQAFLREHPKERAAMAEWESAPLGE